MKTFSYRGFDPGGKAVRGLIEATNPKDARERLAAQGLFAEAVEAAGAERSSWSNASPRGLPVGQRAQVYRELGALLESGLPLSSALDLIIDTPGQPRVAAIMAGVRDGVREGLALAEALARSAGSLRAVEQAMIQTGERTGTLPRSLHALADSLEEQQRVSRHVAGALAYPAFLVLLASVIAVAVFGFLIPRFGRLFADAGLELPWLTRTLIAISGVAPWIAVGALVVIPMSGWLVARQWRENPGFRQRLEQWFYTRRLVAATAGALLSYRFADTLSLLLRGGTPLVDALAHAGAATGSTWIRAEAERATTAVRHGASLSEALSLIPPFQRHLPSWIRAGEAGGNLDEMIAQAARRSQDEARRRIDRTLAWIEPVMIVLVGVFVLLVALAVLLPILSLNRSIG